MSLQYRFQMISGDVARNARFVALRGHRLRLLPPISLALAVDRGVLVVELQDAAPRCGDLPRFVEGSKVLAKNVKSNPGAHKNVPSNPLTHSSKIFKASHSVLNTPSPRLLLVWPFAGRNWRSANPSPELPVSEGEGHRLIRHEAESPSVGPGTG